MCRRWISAPVRPPLGRRASSGHAPAVQTSRYYLQLYTVSRYTSAAEVRDRRPVAGGPQGVLFNDVASRSPIGDPRGEGVKNGNSSRPSSVQKTLVLPAPGPKVDPYNDAVQSRSRKMSKNVKNTFTNTFSRPHQTTQSTPERIRTTDLPGPIPWQAHSRHRARAPRPSQGPTKLHPCVEWHV